MALLFCLGRDAPRNARSGSWALNLWWQIVFRGTQTAGWPADQGIGDASV